MANRFIGLEDAAAQLGISKEQLNEIRESGKVRAYRDGTSWKFRTEEIDTLDGDLKSGAFAQESGIGIDLGSDLSLSSGGLSSLDLGLADDDPSTEDAADDISASDIVAFDELSAATDDDEDDSPTKQSDVSDLDLASLEDPTVPVDADIEDDNESILLSEDELGDSPDRPPSTIIGRSQLRDEPTDDDLQLAGAPETGKTGQDPGLSDVRLADDDDDLGDLLSGGSKPAGADKFEDLEELEFDLEAESSRILESQDVAAAQAAAKDASAQKAAEPKLDFGSGLELAGDSAIGAGAEGVQGPAASSPSDSFSLASDEDDDLEIDLAASDPALGSGVDLKSDGSDDMVLDSSDDDLSLSSGDSGINLKPSDSGLALDDESFDLGGSAIGSSLDLGDSFASSASLAIGGSGASLDGSTAFASSPDFNLQPSDDADDEDEEDSSQIIALDAVEESLDDEPMLTGGGVSMGMPGASATPVIGQEAHFPIWIVAFLALSAMLMAVSAVMAADIIRTMWAWDEPYAIGSPLIEGFLGLIGMNN